MSDMTINTIITQLNKSINKDEKWITPLLKDVDDGYYYVMVDEVYRDDDGDVIIPIKLL